MYMFTCSLEDTEERDDVVIGDSLKETWSTSEGLQGCPNGREEGSNQDYPYCGEC